jgi:alkylation response protein AidB-like acyl-CoA dehydrogenase
MAAALVLIRARQLAGQVLFPSAMNVDNADRVPPANFEAMAAAGLYGLAGPASAGGLDMDLATFCNVIEIMAGG